MEIVVSVKELLEAGVHFGHQTRRWNPKMKQFIFEKRNGIYIIDLQQSVVQLQEAVKFAQETASKGGGFLFVGTKKQAQESIKEAATQCDAYYVNERWLGGTLTNNQTIRKSIKRLIDIEEAEKEGALQKLSKKEASSIRREKQKLTKHLEGVKKMEKLPACLFVVDTKREEIAIAEARKLNIPIIAILDTNCDPDEVDYPIAGNDDAIKSIRLIALKISEAVNLGRQAFDKIVAVQEETAKKEAEKEAKETEKAKKEIEKPAALKEEVKVKETAALAVENAVKASPKTSKKTKE